jgi:ABC-2 type transport system ATP-binding protein
MIIEVEALTKIYGRKTAVDHISFQVKPGQIYGFLGPNGAGKSTMIKMLTGLVYPTSGSGTVLGWPLGNVKARKKMGYLPELFRYQEWMSGNDLLNFHTSLYGLTKDPARNQSVLKLVGLLGQEKFKVGSYSKGMQQRLGLACALLPEPELLFLDEPTSALDPIGRKDVRDIIFTLKEKGLTVFLNSHLLSEVEAVSDSITIINKGRLVQSGTVEELLGDKLTLTLETDAITEADLNFLRTAYDSELNMIGSNRISLKVKSKEDVAAISKYFFNQGTQLFELSPQQKSLENLFLEAVEEGGKT